LGSGSVALLQIKFAISNLSWADIAQLEPQKGEIGANCSLFAATHKVGVLGADALERIREFGHDHVGFLAIG
jgi:hypothetical protein